MCIYAVVINNITLVLFHGCLVIIFEVVTRGIFIYGAKMTPLACDPYTAFPTAKQLWRWIMINANMNEIIVMQ